MNRRAVYGREEPRREETMLQGITFSSGDQTVSGPDIC
jgi:hypothetical protein